MNTNITIVYCVAIVAVVVLLISIGSILLKYIELKLAKKTEKLQEDLNRLTEENKKLKANTESDQNNTDFKNKAKTFLNELISKKDNYEECTFTALLESYEKLLDNKNNETK